MADAAVTTDEWRALYGAADVFKRLRCWEWMNDGQLFGVMDPVTGGAGYCCVLGAAAEVYALAMYRGSEGYEVHSKIRAGIIRIEDEEAIYVQNALMASFEPRDALDDTDRAVIRSLGLKYRGANDWPLFRSHLPGYCPWYLTREEVAFLTHAISQAAIVAVRLKDDPGLLEPPENGPVFMRVPVPKDDGIVWTDAWHTPPRAEREEAALPEVPEERMEAIRAAAQRSGVDWEIDFFHAPMPVREDKGRRPYFARVYCCMERARGMSLDFQLAAAGTEYRGQFRDAWLKLVERTRSLPRTILVKRGEVYDVFETVAGKLGIGIAIDENPMIVDGFRTEMRRHFRSSTDR